MADPAPAQIDRLVGCASRPVHAGRVDPVPAGAAALRGLASALQAMGVFLKGDLPILMSRESVDVWAERSFFDLTGIAGAPPDMFSPSRAELGLSRLRLGEPRTGGLPLVEGPPAPGGQVLPRLSHRPRAGILPHLADPAGRDHGPAGAVFSRRPDSPVPTSRPWASTRDACGGSVSRTHAARKLLRRNAPDMLPDLRASAPRTCTTWPRSTTASRPSRRLNEPQPVKDFLLALHADRTLLATARRCTTRRGTSRRRRAFRASPRMRRRN